MRVRYVATPGGCLPKWETAALLTGEREAVFQLNEDEPIDRLAQALSQLTNEWAAAEWIGPDVTVTYLPVESHEVPGHAPAWLEQRDGEVRYLLNRDVALPVVCAGLTATANEYIRTAWLHVAGLEGLATAR